MRATLSFAGRVEHLKPQVLPVRIGGFGGAEGLADYIRAHNVTHLIDATHPFAAQMSRNALSAAAATEIPLAALTRPAWSAMKGDLWRYVPNIAAAVAAQDASVAAEKAAAAAQLEVTSVEDKIKSQPPSPPPPTSTASVKSAAANSARYSVWRLIAMCLVTICTINAQKFITEGEEVFHQRSRFTPI